MQKKVNNTCIQCQTACCTQPRCPCCFCCSGLAPRQPSTVTQNYRPRPHHSKKFSHPQPLLNCETYKEIKEKHFNSQNQFMHTNTGIAYPALHSKPSKSYLSQSIFSKPIFPMHTDSPNLYQPSQKNVSNYPQYLKNNFPNHSSTTNENFSNPLGPNYTTPNSSTSSNHEDSNRFSSTNHPPLVNRNSNLHNLSQRTSFKHPSLQNEKLSNRLLSKPPFYRFSSKPKSSNRLLSKPKSSSRFSFGPKASNRILAVKKTYGCFPVLHKNPSKLFSSQPETPFVLRSSSSSTQHDQPSFRPSTNLNHQTQINHTDKEVQHAVPYKKSRRTKAPNGSLMKERVNNPVFHCPENCSSLVLDPGCCEQEEGSDCFCCPCFCPCVEDCSPPDIVLPDIQYSQEPWNKSKTIFDDNFHKCHNTCEKCNREELLEDYVKNNQLKDTDSPFFNNSINQNFKNYEMSLMKNFPMRKNGKKKRKRKRKRNIMMCQEETMCPYDMCMNDDACIFEEMPCHHYCRRPFGLVENLSDKLLPLMLLSKFKKEENKSDADEKSNKSKTKKSDDESNASKESKKGKTKKTDDESDADKKPKKGETKKKSDGKEENKENKKKKATEGTKGNKKIKTTEETRENKKMKEEKKETKKNKETKEIEATVETKENKKMKTTEEKRKTKENEKNEKTKKNDKNEKTKENKKNNENKTNIGSKEKKETKDEKEAKEKNKKAPIKQPKKMDSSTKVAKVNVNSQNANTCESDQSNEIVSKTTESKVTSEEEKSPKSEGSGEQNDSLMDEPSKEDCYKTDSDSKIEEEVSKDIEMFKKKTKSNYAKNGADGDFGDLFNRTMFTHFFISPFDRDPCYHDTNDSSFSDFIERAQFKKKNKNKTKIFFDFVFFLLHHEKFKEMKNEFFKMKNKSLESEFSENLSQKDSLSQNSNDDLIAENNRTKNKKTKNFSELLNQINLKSTKHSNKKKDFSVTNRTSQKDITNVLWKLFDKPSKRNSKGLSTKKCASSFLNQWLSTQNNERKSIKKAKSNFKKCKKSKSIDELVQKWEKMKKERKKLKEMKKKWSYLIH